MWHETHVVFSAPVCSLFALANHKSIRSSRYLAAACGSQAAIPCGKSEGWESGWSGAGAAGAPCDGATHKVQSGKATMARSFIADPLFPADLRVKALRYLPNWQ